MIELAHVKVISTLKTKNDFNNNYNVYTCFLEHLKVIVIITITKIYFSCLMESKHVGVYHH